MFILVRKTYKVYSNGEFRLPVVLAFLKGTEKVHIRNGKPIWQLNKNDNIFRLQREREREAWENFKWNEMKFNRMSIWMNNTTKIIILGFTFIGHETSITVEHKIKNLILN